MRLQGPTKQITLHTVDKLLRSGCSNVGTGLFAASIARLSADLLEVPQPWLVISLVFPVAVFSYALDRFLNPKTSTQNTPPMGAILLGGIGWFLASLHALWLGYICAVLHSLIFPISVIAYTYPFFALTWNGVEFRRIKDFPAVKPIYVVFIWTQVGICAWYFSPHHKILPLAIMLSWLFLKLLVNVVACDLVDIEDDRAKGVQTWPVLLGFDKTLAWLQAINAISSAPTISAILVGSLPSSYIWLESLSAFWAMCMACTGPNTPEVYIKAAFDFGSGVILLLASTIVRS